MARLSTDQEALDLLASYLMEVVTLLKEHPDEVMEIEHHISTYDFHFTGQPFGRQYFIRLKTVPVRRDLE